MKKRFIYTLLPIVLLLGACNGQSVVKTVEKTDYFKEYTFERMATDVEITAIKKGIGESRLSLTSVTNKTESYSKTNLRESLTSSESTTKYCDDVSNPNLLIVKTSDSNETKGSSDGITLKQKTTTESTRWDAGNGYVYNLGETKVGKKSEEKASVYQIPIAKEAYQESDSKAYKESILHSAFQNNISGTCYANSDGSFTFISSSVNHNVEAVEWGSSTKEYITSSPSISPVTVAVKLGSAEPYVLLTLLALTVIAFLGTSMVTDSPTTYDVAQPVTYTLGVTIMVWP